MPPNDVTPVADELEDLVDPGTGFLTIHHPEIAGEHQCTLDAFHLAHEPNGWLPGPLPAGPAPTPLPAGPPAKPQGDKSDDLKES